MRKIIIAVMLGMTMLSAVGCNNKKVEITADKAKANEIIITEGKKIQSVIKESFEKKYYKEKDLKKFIEDDLKNFNSANDTAVKMNSMKVKDKDVYVVIDYKDEEEYNKYNEYEITTLKGSEAIKDSVVSDKINVYGRNKKVSKKDSIDKNMKVVIFNEKSEEKTKEEAGMPSEKKVNLKLTVAGKIKYSLNAKKDDGNTAKITSLKEPVVIVYQ